LSSTTKKGNRVSPNLSKEEIKQAFKEAIKEWVDDQFRRVGASIIYAIAAATFGAVIYLILKTGDIESLRPHIR
jgi:hypothetical protein